MWITSQLTCVSCSFAFSQTTSRPGPQSSTSTWSSSARAWRTSLPSPPFSTSAPRPIRSRSFPAPPSTVSSPSRPRMKSFPSEPLRTSSPGPPKMRSLSGPPSTVSSPQPAKMRSRPASASTASLPALARMRSARGVPVSRSSWFVPLMTTTCRAAAAPTTSARAATSVSTLILVMPYSEKPQREQAVFDPKGFGKDRRARSVSRAVLEARGVAAVAAELEAQGAVVHHQLLGDDLLAGLVVARDHARHRGDVGHRARDPDADLTSHAEPLAPGRVVDLDLRGAHGDEVARLPGPREVLHLPALGSAGPDLLERPPLLVVAAFVDVEQERPGRALLVVAVARRERDAEPGQVRVAYAPVDDLPREGALADSVGRAAAGDPVDPPAGADRLAVAGLEVRAGDAPGAACGAAMQVGHAGGAGMASSRHRKRCLGSHGPRLRLRCRFEGSRALPAAPPASACTRLN